MITYLITVECDDKDCAKAYAGQENVVPNLPDTLRKMCALGWTVDQNCERLRILCPECSEGSGHAS